MKRNRPFLSSFARFGANARGVAAVEFALIFPLLAVLYLGTVEITSAVNMHRKVERVAAGVSDLLARRVELTPQEIDDILEVGRSLLYPHGDAGLSIQVAGLRQKDVSEPRIEWSRSSPVDDEEPSGLLNSFDYELSGEDDAFFVLVRVNYDYQTFGYYQFVDPIVMTGLSSSKARLTTNLACAAC